LFSSLTLPLPLSPLFPYTTLFRSDSVGLALLAVLETLDPAERLAFVLHDMFAVPFDEIAAMVERTAASPRQLASRARRKVQGTRSEEHTSELQSRFDLVCRLLLEK